MDHRSEHRDRDTRGSRPRRRIAFVIDTIFEPTSGTEKQLLALLSGIDRRRFDPHLFCLRTSRWLATEARDLAWTDLSLHVALRPSLVAGIRRFSGLLRDGRYELVQTHFRDGNVAGVLASAQAGVRCIVSTRRGVPYWQSRPGLWFLRRLNRRVTRFVANSQATKDHFTRAEGIAPERMDVIHNGLDPRAFGPIPPERVAALRAEIGVPAAVPVVGLVANLRAVKGIADLVHAAPAVLAEHPRTHFVVVGQGPEEGSLREAIRSLGMEHAFHLVGARRDVPQLLRAFDIGVLASHFESFSNSILEYRAAGLPVVVTDVGGAREVVQDGRDGFVVPAGSPPRIAASLCALLDHPGGPRARSVGMGLPEVFHTTTMVRAYESLYDRLLGGEDVG